MKADAKKLKVREAFQDFVKLDRGVGLDKLGDEIRQTQALAHFYIREIHNGLRSPISDEDFNAGYVDGKDDLGIDLIHRDDGVVHIVQVKYAKQGNSIETDKIEHFRTLFTRMIDEKQARNARLAEALADVDFKHDRFELRFVTLGRIEGQARIATQAPPSLPKIEGLADRVSFEFLDETDLTEELRSARAAGRTDTQCKLYSAGIRGDRTPIIELPGEGHRSFVLLVDAPQIVELYQFKGNLEALFTWNIRNYIGSTAVNKAIQSAAENKPVEFFHLNNGISCLATSVTVNDKDHSLTAEDFSVVNGAQTVRSLVKASRKKKWTKEEVPIVLVRVTEAGEGYGAAGRFRERIIRANNTQNTIKISDFRSNDPIQADLKENFGKYKRFGQGVYYMAKRSDSTELPKLSEIIRLEEFAKTIYSFVREPSPFSGSTSFLFDEERDGYRVVFGNGEEVWEAMPLDEFRLRSAVWWMTREFEKALKVARNTEKDANRKAARERKWWFVHAARVVLEAEYGEPYAAILAAEYKGDWKLGDGKVGKWFEELLKRAENAVLFAYEQAADKAGFVHRNWMRNKDTATSIERAVRTLAPYAGHLSEK